MNIDRNLVGRAKPVHRPDFKITLGENPSAGPLEFDWEQRRSGDLQLRMYDAQGTLQKVHRWPQRGPGKIRASLPVALPQGAYQLVFQNKSGLVSRKWLLLRP